MMSCGHIDGVRAENGPPGVGLKSDVEPLYGCVADTLTESVQPSPMSSSSSDKVSTEYRKCRYCIAGIIYI